MINDDEELIWDLKTEPHLLIVGRADTGKTNVARRVIDHIRAQDNMKVSIADTRREGYSAYANDENVDEVAVKPIDATYLILHARAEMKERLDREVACQGVLRFSLGKTAFDFLFESV